MPFKKQKGRKVLFEVQTKVQTLNDMREMEDVWTTKFKWRGTLKRMTAFRSGEQELAATIKSTEVYTVIGRYRSEITSLYRLKYGNRLFNILRLDNIEEKNRELQINVEEIT